MLSKVCSDFLHVCVPVAPLPLAGDEESGDGGGGGGGRGGKSAVGGHRYLRLRRRRVVINPESKNNFAMI